MTQGSVYGESGVMPAPEMAGILVMTLAFLEIFRSILSNLSTLLSEKDVIPTEGEADCKRAT